MKIKPLVNYMDHAGHIITTLYQYEDSTDWQVKLPNGEETRLTQEQILFESTGELRDTLINGKWTLKLPEHRAARAEWWDRWEYERLDSMHANLKPGDVIYDIGAEQMDMTALFATWGCHVVAVEPTPWNWSSGKAIWKANGLARPIATVEGFACSPGDTGGPAAEIYRGAWPPAADQYPLNGSDGFAVINQRPDIPRITMDEIYIRLKYNTGRRVDAITMDIEGAELIAMRGATRILEEQKPLVWISIHPEFMYANFNQYMHELMSLMGTHGYKYKFLAFDHELHTAFWHPEGRELIDG